MQSEELTVLGQEIKSLTSAIHNLDTKFAEYRGQATAEHTSLKELVIQHNKDCRAVVKQHDTDIDTLKSEYAILDKKVENNRVGHEATMKTAKVFGAIGLGVLAFLDLIAVAAGVVYTIVGK